MPRKKKQIQINDPQEGKSGVSTLPIEQYPVGVGATEGEKDASSFHGEHLGTRSMTGGRQISETMPTNTDSQPSVLCSKCKGLGYISEKGKSHTCWDCLNSGRLDVQTEKRKEKTEEKFYCQNCKEEVKFGDNFCKNCGRAQLWALFG